MIFKRALRQELTFTTGVVFMVLVTLVLTNLMIRTLANAASGIVNPKDVLVLMGLGMINYLAVLLAVSLFITVLLVLTRWYKDSEMVIWQSAGLSLFTILKTILWFTAPLAVVIAVLSAAVSPWANEQSNIIKQRFQQRDDVSMIASGQFRESSNNNRVFFIEEIDTETNTMKNVFISTFGKEKQTVSVANEGFIETLQGGDRQLSLTHGRRYEGIAGSQEFRVTEFDRYTVKLDNKEIDQIAPTNRTIQVWDLIKDWNPTNKSELLWRIGLPLMALCFVTIAIPLSYVNPRSGRYTSMIMAVLIYFTYSNLLTLLQNWVKNERFSFAASWWPLHVFTFFLGLLMIYLGQNRSITLRGRFKKYRSRKQMQQGNTHVE
ncbi:LPS export ABC transporter permease LptF [Polynucleobacter sp. MWH-Spelu-300-X4]|uniref:LPS export ABC transporter permease LptF n=1 Tax=Polynucleobacter sp. MWH-Spelu-300-X4 TaxID=2689109 RepID=UPI001BFDBC2D|nr:LPS export ABC transporter permease LptF [Polynucleobacter sp. MWH-Spelu-300-X4]QWD80153.1 LPS export ABC transporter permease LptF [Polynucleobacter sp. MWH-Spelu-300-X4]